MPDLPALIADSSSGVAQIVLERDRTVVGTGSAFLLDGGQLISAHHVLMAASYDTARIRFQTDAPDQGIRIARQDLTSAVVDASPREELDFAVVQLDEPEFATRHKFVIDRETEIVPGKQVCVMGFPYGRAFLTSHVAYVSATYQEGQAQVLQLDGSINPAHSGGPVVDPETGRVVGYVVSAHTGLSDDFDDLVVSLDANIGALSRSGGARIVIGGLDPHDAFRATMVAMRQLAQSLRRSANVGIGFAFSARHLLR